MKTVISYIAIFIGIAALAVSTSKSLSEDIQDRKSYSGNTGQWWGEQTTGWGDLVGMSYLGGIKKFREEKYYDFEHQADDGNKNIDLYLYGDSYTADAPKEAFANVDYYYFHYRYGSHDCILDPRKRSVLIIEVSERFLREKFRDTSLLSNIRVIENNNDRIKPISDKPDKHKPKGTNWIYCLFNPNINHNLEYNLFNYNFLVSPRELKAAVNYKLFNRASGDVVISDNGKYLFYKPTVISDSLTSSYSHLCKNEIDIIVANLDTIYDHYRRVGFAEVYFSPIPSPATILQPAYYNQLMPLIENDPKMKMPVIDVYSIFKSADNPASLYRAGDTHWNNNGMRIWLDNVNNKIKRVSDYEH